jgi:hypothetical protein
MITTVELAEELYKRMMARDVAGGSLDGIKITGGRLYFLFKEYIKKTNEKER